MKRSPSCKCCGCLAYAKDWQLLEPVGDEWEQVAGDWYADIQVPGGKVAVGTTDDDALLIHRRSWPANMAFGFASRNIRYGVRAIFGYLDEDNYCFLERLTTSQTVLGTRIAGVETHVTTEYYIAPPVNNDSLLTTADEHHREDFKFCYNRDVLAAKWGDAEVTTSVPPSWNDNAWLAHVIETLPGTRVGFGTTAITPVGAEARFGPVVVYQSASDAKPDCLDCVDLCCDGPRPTELILEVSGTYTSNSPSYPPETQAAAQIAGTYTLQLDSGDACFWEYVYPGTSNTWALTKTAGGIGLTLYHVNIHDITGFTPLHALAFSSADPINRCEDWIDEQEMSLEFAFVATSNARATVRLP